MSTKNMPIGFFDSGVGGLSVLREAIKLLPNEDFIYFGDSLNAPYGVKSVDEVKELSFHASELLLEYKVKAIVVACNTATSAAIEDLRNTYKDIPIIGIEPALKPAVELNRKGKVVIMATPMTLAERKFHSLMEKYKENADIVPLPCPGLVEYIEKGIVEGEGINSFLREKFSTLKGEKISSVVLGCTHYPFIKRELSKVLGSEVVIIDGSKGTVTQLKRQLLNKDIINNNDDIGKIKILNSLDSKEIIDISKKLLEI
ncbi:glutamate racemase [Clostridium bovifaecis]|uniref:Glutamate racemase n=1 Tax=Clostridium bovifaecis TaxID=2184719 RepID=A0A6I6F2H6_9CLOT|nr:glutamate racemase [Clostridium bovifaecis]